MKIAILSDIHGNIIALREVLKQIKKACITRIFVLGDSVGYYYHPSDVLGELENFEITMIRGNHEAMLEACLVNPEELNWVIKKYGHGIERALKNLSQAQIRMLLSLPESLDITIDGVRFLLCHGSPWNSDSYIFPDAEELVLKKCAEVDADFVLLGHTHRPFSYTHESTIVMNPGSVGQPRDVGNLASWAFIDTKNKSVVHQRALFDINLIRKEVMEIDPDLPYLSDVLGRIKL